MQKKAIDFNLSIGNLKRGRLNKITDVKGVNVGHCTIDDGFNKTGVTVVIPSPKNVFANKLPCAQFVINGYGKTAGLMQIEELGTLETPIALTNTLNVGLVQDALVQYTLDCCQKDGVTAKSINTVVCECNDSSINHIEKRAVGQKEVFLAFEDAKADFLEGAVGAGRGTICHGLKGGIGSASRMIEYDGKEYTLGVLVQSNYGKLSDLTVCGRNIGEKIAKKIDEDTPCDKGSIIMILATDIPCSVRQLKRIIKRCSVGLARMGSYIGNGSGEVIIGFSTAYDFSVNEENDIVPIKVLTENKIDKAFRAAAEATEEAVLNSLLAAKPETKIDGTCVHSFLEFFELL